MKQVKEGPRGVFVPTDRLETLSDGIFAIAMTILVVTIEIPVGPVSSYGLLMNTMGNVVPKFAVYFLSFLILAVFWIIHHMFYVVKKADFTLIWINIFWLMFIALIPLSTSVIAQFGHYQFSQLIFDINLLFIGFFYYLMWSYAVKHHLLADSVMPYSNYIQKTVLFLPGVIMIAIIISFINPRWSMISLFLIPVLFVVGRKLWIPKKIRQDNRSN
ncbi:MAG: TMEM175 family protein [Methanobacteriaceae archaeon]